MSVGALGPRGGGGTGPGPAPRRRASAGGARDGESSEGEPLPIRETDALGLQFQIASSVNEVWGREPMKLLAKTWL